MGDALSCSLWDQISFTKAKQTWCFIFIFNILLILEGSSGCLTWVKTQQPQEQRYPFLSARAVFLFVQTRVRLPVFRIFDVPTDADACDCALGLYGHRKRVSTWVKTQQPQEQRYPFLSVRAVFLFVQTRVRLPVFRIFDVPTDADACDCALGLYGHRKRVSTWVKTQQPQEQRYPFLSVRAVFLFVQTRVRLPVFRIFDVPTDADACDCTLGLYGHRKRVSTWVKTQQPQEQRYPFLSVRAVFLFVQTTVRLPVFRIFDVPTDADACDCTLGLYGHRKRVSTASWLWEKNPFLH